ncbi:MAG: hypothetical protein HFI33_02660 [Lachnospiraceae bacterium]|nr:hypothetical protein [Lachnospiraceae bacterium]
MKKLGKFLASMAIIGGIAAGAYTVYKKFFAVKEDEEDFDDDFNDGFDEDLEEPKREYVSLNSVQEPAQEAHEVSAEAIAEKEAAMAEAETAKAKEEAE